LLAYQAARAPGVYAFVTYLFDSVFIWGGANVPIAFALSRFMALPVVTIYICVQLGDLIKCVIGSVLVKKGVWMQNIVSGE
ncbi:MAG: MATE family efflux transporter, partial [Lachnospiraceae bacterium]|nr:MATE family efflux transporter [Lachnospiraceae bacterium]